MVPAEDRLDEVLAVDVVLLGPEKLELDLLLPPDEPWLEAVREVL